MAAVNEIEFKTAVGHVQAGRLAAGEAACRRILATDPRHDRALNLLGVITSEQGDIPAGITLIEKAIALAPANASYHCNLGLFLERADRSDDAVTQYQAAILLNPNYPEARLNLGIALMKLKDRAGAIASYRKAIELRANYPKAHNCLGIALRADGQIDAAIASHRLAIAQKPDLADAWNNLGNALGDRGETGEAIASYRRAIELAPDSFAALNNLGLALVQIGKSDEAIAIYRRAILLRPDRAEIQFNLANVLHEIGQEHPALDSLRQALLLQPIYPEAHVARGVVLKAMRMERPAIECFEQAIRQNPDFADAHFHLANALVETGQFIPAVEAYQRVLALHPQHTEAMNNLANLLKDQGQIDDALSLYRRALLLAPDYIAAHDNLLYTSLYDPASPPELPLEQGLGWDRRHAHQLADSVWRGQPDTNPDRRLRVGYVSPDFREHSVSRFILPLLAAHDKSVVEIFCYANVKNPDRVTAELQQHAQGWRDIANLNDAAAATVVRQDQVDILVDLAGHSGDNRLGIFTRRPAPIQVTYLGYPATTGLRSIDYRLTDAVSDPPGSERFYSEKLIRLTRTMWCFARPIESPAPVEAPVIHQRQLTFGSFNNFAKVNSPLLDLWAKILLEAANSRLVLKARGVESPGVQSVVLKRMADRGVAVDRIDFIGWSKADQHLGCYHDIDIALDTFPYNGTTTTCEALWMGVPVISMAGASHVSRVGLSILKGIGHEDWVAESPDDYVAKAVDLAINLDRLVAVRKGLRERFASSSMMRPDEFSRDVEHAYRMMWQRHLQEGGQR